MPKLGAKQKESVLFKKLNSRSSKTIAGYIRYDCGELLSKGLNRDVYVCKHDPEWVVKIQRTNTFDNVMEWKIWCAYLYAPEYKKWLADCLTISENGMVLFQKRVAYKAIEFYPETVPCWFTDFKVENYGWIGKRFVCCDYASSFDRLTGLAPNRLRRPKWWSSGRGKVNRNKNRLISI